MIYMNFPGIPPSDNHAYFTLMSGRGNKRHVKRVLTKVGRAYKTELSTGIVQRYAQELPMFKPNTPYGYLVQLYIGTLLNITWPEKAESRYKKLDALNRSKLLQDTMGEAFGIDDSQFMSCRFDKISGPDHTHIYVWNLELEDPYSKLAEVLSKMVT